MTVAAPPRPAAGVAGRALLVLALLVGFYLLALLVVLALAGLTVEAGLHHLGPVAGKLGLVTLGVALALGRAVLRVGRGTREQPPGLPVSRSQEPGLWAVVDEVARDVGAAAPDELRLVDDVNAYVMQRTRLLGLVGGRRTMGVGLALLHTVTVAELRGVLAHEYGHYSGGDTRLRPLTYRATATVRHAVAALGSNTPVGAYAGLVLRTALAVNRRQELSADAVAARLVGAATHERALRAVHAGDAAYAFFLDSYVQPLAAQGVVPADLYNGFAALLADPRRRCEIEEVRNDVDATPADPYDSHPSLAERLALLDALPAGSASAGDGRPATAVLADVDAAGRAVTAQLIGDAPELTVLADSFASAGPHYAAPRRRAGSWCWTQPPPSTADRVPARSPGHCRWWSRAAAASSW